MELVGCQMRIIEKNEWEARHVILSEDVEVYLGCSGAQLKARHELESYPLVVKK